MIGARTRIWCAVAVAAVAVATAAARPNVVVLFTDDQGWADLSCQEAVADVRTPNIDRMASEGVRFTDGYITAPQCSPSRAGLVTGRYQQRFGIDSIPDCPLPMSEVTIADRLRTVGYVTGMVGKWHLEPNAICRKWAQREIPALAAKHKRRIPVPFSKVRPYLADRRGYCETFAGEWKRYWASYDLKGGEVDPPRWIADERFRIDVQSDAAVAFIRRHKGRPFFLHVGFFAPHTPLEATKKYLDRFPGEMPERRRYALAMISAIDDGVGRILGELKTAGIEDRTLVFFASDNGAPLKITKPDNPVNSDAGGWDGSLNDPLVGEKGMLTEGGIRVPFVARWKGKIPAGQIYEEPVISLDFGATALVQAGLPVPAELDGVDLLPFLTGMGKGVPHEALYWRFWSQTAVRKGPWKFLRAGGKGRFLFNLDSPEGEKKNLVSEEPELAAELETMLEKWADELKPAGIPAGPLNVQEVAWFRHYLGFEE